MSWRQRGQSRFVGSENVYRMGPHYVSFHVHMRPHVAVDGLGQKW